MKKSEMMGPRYRVESVPDVVEGAAAIAVVDVRWKRPYSREVAFCVNEKMARRIAWLLNVDDTGRG